MSDALKSGFRLADWQVIPLEGRLIGADAERRLRPRAMDVLLCLAEHAGEVVERDALVRAVWGERAVTDEPLTRAIADLRHALGDSAGTPKYIETIPKRGYRLVADVHLAGESREKLVADARPRSLASLRLASVAALVAIVATVVTLKAFDGDPPAGSPRGDKPAIAVLPFESLSPDESDELFSDGLSDTLTQVLAEVEGLKVIARTSAFVFKDQAEDVRTIGEKLGVDAVLEGTVQRDASTLRIIPKLVSTSDGSNLWTQRFDRQPADLFAVQDEIAAAVAAALHITLLPEPRDRTARTAFATTNLQAYNAYVEGRRNLSRRTSASINAAIDNFREAVDIDPDYSLAWVGLADSHVVLRYYGNISLADMESNARQAIDRALELDPELGEAYASTGLLNWELSQIPAAEAALRRAIALAPNYSQAYFWLATVYNDTGRAEEALRLHRLALELDPLAPAIHNAIAVSLEKLGRFDEARAQFEHVMAIDPGYAATIDRAAQLHWSALAKLDDAVRLEKRALEVDPGYPIAPALLTELYLDLGDLQDAELWMNEAMRLGPETPWPLRAQTMILSYRDEQPEQRIEFALGAAASARNSETRDILTRAARDAYLARGDSAAAVALYEQIYPQLSGAQPELNSHTLQAAVDFACALLRDGQTDRAHALLDAAHAAIASLPRLGCCGFGTLDVEIHALRGDVDEAVGRLAEAIAAGWRRHWWWKTRANPALAALSDSPRYQSLLNELQLAVEAQHASVSNQ